MPQPARNPISATGSLSEPKAGCERCQSPVTLEISRFRSRLSVEKAFERPIAAHLWRLRDELLASDGHGRDVLEAQTLDKHLIYGCIHINIYISIYI